MEPTARPVEVPQTSRAEPKPAPVLQDKDVQEALNTGSAKNNVEAMAQMPVNAVAIEVSESRPQDPEEEALSKGHPVWVIPPEEVSVREQLDAARDKMLLDKSCKVCRERLEKRFRSHGYESPRSRSKQYVSKICDGLWVGNLKTYETLKSEDMKEIASDYRVPEPRRKGMLEKQSKVDAEHEQALAEAKSEAAAKANAFEKTADALKDEMQKKLHIMAYERKRAADMKSGVAWPDARTAEIVRPYFEDGGGKSTGVEELAGIAMKDPELMKVLKETGDKVAQFLRSCDRSRLARNPIRHHIGSRPYLDAVNKVLRRIEAIEEERGVNRVSAPGLVM